MKTVLFACIHNAGRSQMAATFFNKLANPDKAKAVSAGTNPGARVHPEVIEVMKPLGVDLSSAVPQKLTRELAEQSVLLITMGCGDECPLVPGLRRDDWPMDKVREIRNDVEARIRSLIAAEGWASIASESAGWKARTARITEDPATQQV